jgi:hypothetical protein
VLISGEPANDVNMTMAEHSQGGDIGSIKADAKGLHNCSTQNSAGGSAANHYEGGDEEVKNADHNAWSPKRRDNGSNSRKPQSVSNGNAVRVSRSTGMPTCTARQDFAPSIGSGNTKHPTCKSSRGESRVSKESGHGIDKPARSQAGSARPRGSCAELVDHDCFTKEKTSSGTY